MSPELDLQHQPSLTPSRSPLARAIALGASVALGITAFSSLAPARLQDPAEPVQKGAAKPKAATKKAEPAAEATPPAEVAPDSERKPEPLPPPGFSKVPKTASELWEVVDYFIRSGQAQQAVPYIQQFLALQPDNVALLKLRDEFGMGAFFRLGDAAATRPFLKQVTDLINTAAATQANDPARIQNHVAALVKSDDERRHAINELRSAGSYAVPPILQALKGATGDDRRKLIDALGRLDVNALPALIAALESKDEAEVIAVETALARIGDQRAVPDLTWIAARPTGPGKTAAADAVAQITGHPVGSDHPATEILSDEARRYLLGKVGDPQMTIWTWDEAAGVPTPKTASKAKAEYELGSKFAKEALSLDPANLNAQKTLVAIALDTAPAGQVPPAALAAGSNLLSAVVRQAITDKRPDLAVKAIAALGKVSDRNTLGASSQANALVDALKSPDRRIQIAAAEAIVNLDPTGSFPGSSRVVPILARFAANPRQHAAVVIDGNSVRATQVAGFLQAIGYDPRVATQGEEGFRQAAGAANVELVVIDPSYLGGSWTWKDTLSNLRADARTAGVPVFLVGPLSLSDRYTSKIEGYSGVHFVVTPTETQLFKGQIDRALARQGVKPLTEDERAAYALKASQLLTKIAKAKASPFSTDLKAVEPDLVLALNHTATAEAAASALGDIPGEEAQRSLAFTLLEATRPVAARLKAAEALAHSLRRFGPLLSAQQEVLLVQSLETETNPALRTAIATVIGALKPKPATVGRLLRANQFPTLTK